MLRSIAVAFATYSIIPMPVFEWKDEDLKYSMCAFPLVGAVLFALSVLACRLTAMAGIGNVLTAAILTLLPLIVTGGIHMDGYMDTYDALCSYGDKDKKLEILKDPHLGAFAVIHAVCHIMLTFALWHELVSNAFDTGRMMIIYAVGAGYVVSRILSALSVVTFKKAKDSGMVSDISRVQDSKVRIILIIMLAAAFVASELYFKAVSGIIIVPAVFTFIYYRTVSCRKFGGITGDLAGWFLQKCELYILMAAVAYTIFM